MKKIEKIEEILKNIQTETLKESDKDEKLKKIEELKEKDKIFDQELQFLREYEKKLKEFYTHSQDTEPVISTFIYESITTSEEKEEKDQKEQLRYRVEITPDEQKCFLTLESISNFTVSYDDIIDILNKYGVKMGILEENIKSIIERFNRGERIENELVAEGRMPQIGDSAYFLFKFQNDDSLVQKYVKSRILTDKSIEESEKKEPHEIQFLIEESLKHKRILCGLVKKGDVLAEKVPPTKGEDGFTVKGKIIPGRMGEDAHLRIKRNVKFDKDYNLYIAEIDGEAILDDDILWVRRYTPGTFHIKISEDEMTVYLTIIPSIGGAEPASIEDIKLELKKQNITVPIDEESIKIGIKEAEEKHKVVYNIKIAEGKKPINGDDGYIEYKINLASGKKFKELEDGRIDFKEQDLLTIVKRDDLIAVVHKPTSGKENGITVTGKTLLAEPGKPFEMEAGKNVRTVEYQDRTEFYSEIDGHLKIEYRSLTVLPVYIVEEDVDFSTGNIKFSGDVIIRGDVKDEFKVFAEGDIMINGNIGASEIRGKRDIIVKNGVLGKHKGKIICDGSFYGKFVENGYIESNKDVFVENAIIQSKIYANGTINVTRNRGQIIGGKIWAGNKIIAKNIGTSSGVKTELIVGYNFKIKRGLEEIKEERNEHSRTLLKIDEVIKQLFKEQPNIKRFSDTMKKLYVESVRKKAIIVGQFRKLKQKEIELQKKLIINEAPEIIVNETIFSDVKIDYLGKIFIIQEPYYKVKIKKEPEKNRVKILNIDGQRD